MGVKISALPPVGTPALTDIFPEVQPAVGGTTYKATFNQLLTLYKENIVTPANGGILYTDATQVQLLAPTATAHQVLLSGASSAPTWSTATYPVTTTINQLLYSSSANTIAGLATGNNGTLITSAGGVPSISSTLPSAVQTNITALGAQSQALNMNSHLINNVTDPASAQDAATKAYVDAVAKGLNIQASVVAASTTAYTVLYNNGASGVGATLTNNGALAAFSADGVSPTVGQRVLIKNQAATLQNGIYTVTTVGSGAVAWVLTRATDFDEPSEIQPGDLVPVQPGGTTNGGTSWMQTATVTTVGTDPVTFIQFSASIPVNVASGGTGNTSATAYAVLCGGITATGAFQSIASVGTSGQVLTSNGAGALPTFQASSAPSAASQADQETGTSTTTYVSPGRQQYHASAAKAWANITYSGGVPTAASSYNITSLTDIATGAVGLNLTTAMSSANYSACASLNYNAGASGLAFLLVRLESGSIIDVYISAASPWADPGLDKDISVQAFGDQ